MSLHHAVISKISNLGATERGLLSMQQSLVSLQRSLVSESAALTKSHRQVA
jgi:hypothetical protein